MMKRLLLFTLTLFLCFFAYSTVITVGQTGGYDYNSIALAVEAAQAGDTVIIFEGTYFETVYVYNKSYLSIIGAEGNSVIIDGENGTREYSMRMANCTNIYVRNIGIKGGYWTGLELRGPSSNILFDGIEVYHNIHPDEAWSYGLVIKGEEGTVSHVEIRNSQIHSNRGHGLYVLYDVKNVLVNNCQLYNNGMNPGEHADNIVLADWEGTDYGPANIEIKNCEIFAATRQGISTWFAKNLWIHHNHFHNNGATGIQIEDGVENFIVENNVSENNQQYFNTETGIWIDDAVNGLVQHNKLYQNQVGIKISKSENVIVRNNIVANNQKDNDEFLENGGIYFLAYENIDCKNIAVYNNTFHNIGNSNLNYFDKMIAYSESGSASIENTYLANNIFSELLSGHMIYMYSDNNNSMYGSDYNCFFDDETFQTYILGEEQDWDYYLNLHNQEQHSIYGDPEFKNSEVLDFSLFEDSPCVDAGMFLAQTSGSGTDTDIPIDNVSFLSDGYGITGGDTISIGTNHNLIIQSIDYENSEITINQSISFEINDPVCTIYNGNRPDIGAIESPYTSSISKETFANLEIEVYPNPFANSFKIKKPELPIVKIQIIDIYGRVIPISFKESSLDYQIKVLGEANSGLLFLKLQFKDFSQTLKVVSK